VELNAAHQLLVYADDINIFGGSTNTTQKNTEALLKVSRLGWSRGKHREN
jgi:hypothetical protein